MIITTNDFIELAKDSVVYVMNEKHNINIINKDELEVVWFAHELGNKKCTMWGKPMGIYYAEITYNKTKNELYVDIYKKQSKTVITYEE